MIDFRIFVLTSSKRCIDYWLYR